MITRGSESHIMNRTSFLLPALAALLALLVATGPLAAQATNLAGQRLGRGYWHVFIAYAVAWVLVLGWTVAIGRRLTRVARRLERGTEEQG